MAVEDEDPYGTFALSKDSFASGGEERVNYNFVSEEVVSEEVPHQDVPSFPSVVDTSGPSSSPLVGEDTSRVNYNFISEEAGSAPPPAEKDDSSPPTADDSVPAVENSPAVALNYNFIGEKATPPAEKDGSPPVGADDSISAVEPLTAADDQPPVVAEAASDEPSPPGADAADEAPSTADGAAADVPLAEKAAETELKAEGPSSSTAEVETGDTGGDDPFGLEPVEAGEGAAVGDHQVAQGAEIEADTGGEVVVGGDTGTGEEVVPAAGDRDTAAGEVLDPVGGFSQSGDWEDEPQTTAFSGLETRPSAAENAVVDVGAVDAVERLGGVKKSVEKPKKSVPVDPVAEQNSAAKVAERGETREGEGETHLETTAERVEDQLGREDFRPPAAASVDSRQSSRRGSSLSGRTNSTFASVTEDGHEVLVHREISVYIADGILRTKVEEHVERKMADLAGVAGPTRRALASAAVLDAEEGAGTPEEKEADAAIRLVADAVVVDAEEGAEADIVAETEAAGADIAEGYAGADISEGKKADAAISLVAAGAVVVDAEEGAEADIVAETLNPNIVAERAVIGAGIAEQADAGADIPEENEAEGFFGLVANALVVDAEEGAEADIVAETEAAGAGVAAQADAGADIPEESEAEGFFGLVANALVVDAEEGAEADIVAETEAAGAGVAEQEQDAGAGVAEEDAGAGFAAGAFAVVDAAAFTVVEEQTQEVAAGAEDDLAGADPAAAVLEGDHFAKPKVARPSEKPAGADDMMDLGAQRFQTVRVCTITNSLYRSSSYGTQTEWCVYYITNLPFLDRKHIRFHILRSHQLWCCRRRCCRRTALGSPAPVWAFGRPGASRGRRSRHHTPPSRHLFRARSHCPYLCGRKHFSRR